jgi:DNA-directed RNA polymerase subunit RPC12/RpoP
MVTFKCLDCGHVWKFIFWEETEGTKVACPECKGLNVYQIKKLHGWDREGRYAVRVNEKLQNPDD